MHVSRDHPSLLTLLACAAWVAVTRLHTLAEPLEQDIATYAVIAHELLAGRPLYSDLWDHKPPGIHVTYAAVEVALGYGPASIHVLGVAMAILTLVGIYRVGATLGGREAGLWSAAFWSIPSGDLFLQASQPNTEVFINAAFVWALSALLRADETPPAAIRIGAAGLLLAATSMYKHVTVPGIALLIAVRTVSRPATGPDRGRTVQEAALLLGMGLAVWASVGLYFAITRRFGAFVDAVFTFNRWYAEMKDSVPVSLVRGLTGPNLDWPSLTAFLPLAGAVMVGVLLRLRRGDRHLPVTLGAWALGTHLAVAAPGHFYPHYYQLWLPLLALGAGLGASEVGARLARLGGSRHLVGAALLAWLLVHALPQYAVTAEDWSRIKYGAAFTNISRLAPVIDSLLEADETFYQWGDAPGLYFLTRRRLPTGLVYVLPLVAGPLVEALSSRVIAQLDQAQPQLVLILKGSLPAGMRTHPVLDWVLSRYRAVPVNTPVGLVTLFVRRGGALEDRLRLASHWPLRGSLGDG